MLAQYHSIPTDTLRSDSGFKILQLLEEDAQLAINDHLAESLQLELIVDETSQNDPTTRTAPQNPNSRSLDDESLELAMQLEAQELQREADARLAEELHRKAVADEIASQQTMQRLAAEGRNAEADAAFARALQADLNAGGDNDHDAEQLLGVEAIMKTLRPTDDHSSISGRGKGKDKTRVDAVDEEIASVLQPDDDADDGSAIGERGRGPAKLFFQGLECGICFELIGSLADSSYPSNEASSSKTLLGIRLSCSGSHAFCLDCLRTHVRTAFEDASFGRCIFPIGCPQCDLFKSEWSISDEEAYRFLTFEDWDKWIQFREKESRAKIYCPMARCSALLFIDDLDSSRAPFSTCSSCNTSLCTSCESTWHEGFTCDEYQALPEDERSPEDLLLLSKARVEHWRRCPGCKMVIALTDGCRHITCRCGTQFCYRCGAAWSKTACSRVPSCDLWSEEELIRDEQVPQGEARLDRNPFDDEDIIELAPVVDPEPVYEPAPTPEPADSIASVLSWDEVQLEQRSESIVSFGEDFRARHPQRRKHLDWSEYPDQIPTEHAFTGQMVSSLTCGYCSRRFFRLRSLEQHLNSVQKHAVWKCCGKCFREVDDYRKHKTMSHG